MSKSKLEKAEKRAKEIDKRLRREYGTLKRVLKDDKGLSHALNRFVRDSGVAYDHLDSDPF